MNRFRFLPNSPFGRLFVVTVQLHLAKDALALHLLPQDLKGLVDIVVAYENLHSVFLFIERLRGPMPGRSGHWHMGMHDSPVRWRPGHASMLYFRLLTDKAGCHLRDKDDLARSLFEGSPSREPALLCIHHIRHTRYLNNDRCHSFVFCRLDDEVDDSLAIPTLNPLVYLYCARRLALRRRSQRRL